MNSYLITATSLLIEPESNSGRSKHEMRVVAERREDAARFFQDTLEEEGYTDIQDVKVLAEPAYMTSWSRTNAGRRTDTWVYGADGKPLA